MVFPGNMSLTGASLFSCMSTSRPLEISRALEMSERLVNEYIALIVEKEFLLEDVNGFT